MPGKRLLWFEGLAELRRGRPGAAALLLRSAFDGLAALGANGYAAACALDLAEAHLAIGDADAAAGDVIGDVRRRIEAASAGLGL